MAARITNDVIKQINELYIKIGVKAKVARELGISPSTVSKYIIPDYIPDKDLVITHCSAEVKENYECFMRPRGEMGDICVLSDEEWEDLRALQKEVQI